MEVIVRISEQLDQASVTGFLSTLKIPNMSVDRVAIPGHTPSQEGKDPNTFSVVVEPGGENFTECDAQMYLDNSASSLLLFNADVQSVEEPKVIYMTDYSAPAREKLERFKRLRPAGFLGATVIEDTETTPTKITWNEVSKQILQTTRATVQSTRANLIIANYDLKSSKRETNRAECLAKLVKQNRCHVLILKT